MGATNPLRYRGYYYDTELGLYYLSSRYYDPNIGRFINADSMIDGGAGLLGNNLFIYCANNPVNAYDPTGHGVWWIDWGKSIWEAAQQRTAAMMAKPSVYTVGNWLTLGTFDAVKGAFAPEKPLSLQHWVSGAAVALMVTPAVSGASKLAKSIKIPKAVTKTPVIGKMRDLNVPGAIKPNEYKVADLLPDMGSPKLNWKQNSNKLRKIMSNGQPIRDASPFPMSNAGFLGAERNLLTNHNWTYSNGYWAIFPE